MLGLEPMPIDVFDPVASTCIFAALFFGAVFLSFKKKIGSDLFPPSLSQELKGFAMLAIVFAHIGYFLVNDHRFLFPLSIFAGVGVDLFLFLSGFGLTVSALKKTLSPKEFYKRHLPKLYVPLFITLGVFFSLDFFFLSKAYPLSYIAKSLAGIFTHADLFQDINSPLWYLTFILFFYLLFPLLFFKQKPLVSALLMYAAAKMLFFLHLPLFHDVRHLHIIHGTAFPLGVAIGALYTRYPKERDALKKKMEGLGNLPYALLCLFFVITVCYFAYFSEIGTPLEEYVSLIVVGLILALFMLKRFEIGLFYLFGVYSYEIYLIHWPLISRYDSLYRYMPAWLATALYLPLLLGISFVLHKGVALIFKRGKTRLVL